MKLFCLMKWFWSVLRSAGLVGFHLAQLSRRLRRDGCFQPIPKFKFWFMITWAFVGIFGDRLEDFHIQVTPRKRLATFLLCYTIMYWDILNEAGYPWVYLRKLFWNIEDAQTQELRNLYLVGMYFNEVITDQQRAEIQAAGVKPSQKNDQFERKLVKGTAYENSSGRAEGCSRLVDIILGATWTADRLRINKHIEFLAQSMDDLMDIREDRERGIVTWANTTQRADRVMRGQLDTLIQEARNSSCGPSEVVLLHLRLTFNLVCLAYRVKLRCIT